MKHQIALLATCAFLSLNSMASSANTPEIMSITVRFDDLNVATEGGAASLYRRIKAAAERICGPDVDVKSSLLPAYTQCVHDAVARAVGDVNRPAVTLYAMRRGMAPPAQPVRIAARHG